LQEEAAILRKPLLIPREFTERPEMLNKFNLLVPTPKELISESSKLINNKSELLVSIENSNLLYGEDEVITKIVNIINS